MAVYIFAARIYLDSDPTVANASDIGLYDDADNGTNQVFRWVESDISAYSPTYTWKTGIFTPQPIDNINESVDLALGGNLPSINGSNIRIANTLPIGGTMTQFDATVEAADIRFNGLRCDIIRFELSAGALMSADGDIVFRGICGDPTFNEREYKIPVRNSNIKRESNLGTLINSDNYPNADGDIVGQSVPVTFGEFKPEFDSNDNPIWNGYSQFKRTANAEDVFKINITAGPYSIFGANGLYSVADSADFDTEEERILFPIVASSGSPPRDYDIKISSEAVVWHLSDYAWPVGVQIIAGKWDIETLEGQYIFVAEAIGDASDNQGAYRQISKATLDLDVNPDGDIISLKVEDYFETTLGGNVTATAVDQCWIKILNIHRKYSADVWPCKDYLNESGVKIISGLNLLSYQSPKKAKVTNENTDAIVEESPLSFYRLPQYAYEDSQLGINNELDIDVKLFDNTPDQMDSFLLSPPQNVELITDVSDLEDLGFSGWTKEADGIFKTPNNVIITSLVAGYINNLTDKRHSTISRMYVEASVGAGTPTRAMVCFKFELPDYPKKFSYDSMYFGVRSRAIAINVANNALRLSFRWKRFVGSHTVEFANQIDSAAYPGGIGEDILDQYYSSGYDTNNRYFYVDQSSTIFTGYMNFEINGMETEEKYKSIKLSAFFFYFPIGISLPEAYNLDIHQVAIIFRKSISIKKAIYSPHRGRIYRASWGTAAGTSVSSSSSSSQSSPSSSSSSSSSSQSFPSSSSSSSESSSSSSVSSPSSSSSSSSSCGYGAGRKNACAMINNPIDILEHTMRLQNWSEQGETREWGKEYAGDPLIDVATTEGGFDYEDLDFHKTLRPARQIKQYRNTSTIEIAKSISKQFFIVSHQDPLTGKERCAYIAEKSLTTPTTTITLSDIIGPIADVVYPETRNIYPEPIIKYARNNATGDFEKTLQVTNTNESTFVESYVIGASGTTAEMLWTRGHVLWEATRSVETLPNERANLTWYTKDEDAIWYLETLYLWMGAVNTDGTPSGITYEPKKRIAFSVPYETGVNWFLTQHHILQLSHQTNSQSIEFVIEKISKNIKKGQEKVTVQVILYGDASNLAYYVKDTVNAGVTLDDWQDSVDKKVDVPAQGEDIKDSV